MISSAIMESFTEQSRVANSESVETPLLVHVNPNPIANGC